MMGVNDAAEMLEAAKAECARLERDLAAALAEVKRLVNLPSVQQPNREALAEVAYRAWCHARRGNPMDDREYEAIRSRVEFEWMHEVADAVLASLAVPATGEVEWQYGRRERSTGRIGWLAGRPSPDWWGESQETWEHVRRQVGPAVVVTP